MKRGIRLALLSVGLAGVITAATVAPGAATPPSGLTNVPLARGTNQSDGTIPLRGGTDVAMAEITVNPGGSAGWHSHPGGAIVVVKQGELTVYALGKGDDEQGQSQSDQEGGPRCVITRYTHGQSFIERIGEVVDAVNTGSTDTVLLVTFPGVPVGGSSRIDMPDPGTCPGV